MANWQLIEEVRARNPLVHVITNIVVANDLANGLLALGASPIMASAVEEMVELGGLADVVVINIGTLNADLVASMLAVGKAANAAGTPVVLDPVGVGATAYRRETVRRLLAEIQFAVIRGNIGELASIAGVDWNARGVDAGSGDTTQATDIALKVAREYKTVVAISGAVDTISDGEHVRTIKNGDPLLPQITGSGCLLSCMIAAFVSVTDDYLTAVVTASASYAIASEYAAKTLKRNLPASFRIAFIDELALLHTHDHEKLASIEEVR
ncbi:hydroxyethylthiazole kinase [Listeria weihenstephanensis FSL R9-0317]|uniref:Hydroxyethylthiazole kinase n=1 Tax=Listeria weihenstephanensis TaxID=1006155 RepID=A0A1S7FY06_9LIST|nr:hydroxyethylthiazole kinase [Listeria weihenstephanensis]AQY52247.1 hydroxyethylthiazole kinase [Listeria weihenstephanensis]EUJ35359.1 hydroxyethylthiazole kinase [Listeria weihenstephanensis FSL R9-0317]